MPSDTCIKTAFWIHNENTSRVVICCTILTGKTGNSYPLPCGRNSWLRSVGSRLTVNFSGAHHNLFYYWGSNLRGHSRFYHGNTEQYWDGSILSTTPQCFSYHDYPSRLVIESSAGHDYEVRDRQPSRNQRRCRPLRKARRWKVCRENRWVRVYPIYCPPWFRVKILIN